jgi:hypothetical protein
MGNYINLKINWFKKYGMLYKIKCGKREKNKYNIFKK